MQNVEQWYTHALIPGAGCFPAYKAALFVLFAAGKLSLVVYLYRSRQWLLLMLVN
jgi:hypothetical protein